jgi:predicted HAD superfamily Cof-like phosphohydrolase
MKTNADMVRQFHLAFGLPAREEASAKIPEGKLRYELMFEELTEYCVAVASGDIIEIADALADLLYVVYGTAIAHGIPIDAVFEEVHRSNMTKLGEDGLPLRRKDGKILKSDKWDPPDIAKVFRALGISI